MTSKRWEYTILPMTVQTLDGQTALLNALGRARWELVGAFPTPNHLVFKREIKAGRE